MKSMFYLLMQSGADEPINNWKAPTFGEWFSAHWLEIVIVVGFVITIILLTCIIRILNAPNCKKKCDNNKDKKD